MGILYAKEGKLYATDYTEIYVPLVYFDERSTTNLGSSVETLGIVYIRGYPKGVEGKLSLLGIPAVINLEVYDFEDEEIRVHGRSLPVKTLKYMKDAYVFHQTIPQGRQLAEFFLTKMLFGKLPKTLNYADIIDMWWKNLEVSGVDYKVPSKILEFIVANIYRSPRNIQDRYGQVYGLQKPPNGYDYVSANVRKVVQNMSTFSGMVYEDMGNMITSAVNNSIEGREEPISPLEKIIYY